MRALITMFLIGCGRIGFDPSAGAGDASPLSFDAPPLPATLVCSAQRFAIPPVGPATELAVDWNGAQFTAMWLDHGAVVAMQVDAGLNATAAHTLVAGPVDGVAGLLSAAVTVFVTTSGSNQTLWSSPTLTSAVVVQTEASVAARPPIVTDATGIPRAWLRGASGGLEAQYVNADGTLKTPKLIPLTFPVTAVATAPNSDHGHMAWSEDEGGGVSHCTQADLDFISPNMPQLGSFGDVSMDCYEPRIDSGPPAADAIFTTFRTTLRSVEMTYLGGIPNVMGTLSPRGRAPRPRFDGTRFWVAWLDEPATGDVLRIAAVEEDLAMRAVDLPGWVPVGDQAFEVVRGTDGVYLFVLGSDTLSVMRTCP